MKAWRGRQMPTPPCPIAVTERAAHVIPAHERRAEPEVLSIQLVCPHMLLGNVIAGEDPPHVALQHWQAGHAQRNYAYSSDSL